MEKYKIIFNSELSFNEKIKKSENLAMHEVQKVINFNIKKYFKGFTVWTEKYSLYKNKDNNWYNHTSYYYSDLRNISKDDWRFCEVLDARKDVSYNKLVLLQETHNLKQNHSRDYISYLDQTQCNTN